MSDDFLGVRKKALVDAFFHRKDMEKLDKLRSELERKKTLDEIRSAAWIDDDVVLEGLFDQGLTGETVAALALVPLVHVAWADGRIQPKEREAIMSAASKKGIVPESAAAALLTDWLSEGEPDHLFDTWVNYTESLMATLDPSVREALATQITGFARKTAEAAGGFLGIGSITKSETNALAQIEAAFKAN